MARRTLDRRTLLRGAFGGAAVTVALPPLEIFFNSAGTAYASGDPLPKRFGIFFWGNGVHPDRWVPQGTGSEWTLSEQLEPLAPVKDRITVVTGMKVLTGNTIPHWSGPAGMLSGAPLIVRGSGTDDSTFAAPTLDQVVASELGGATRFRSLELGARPDAGVSFNGPDSRNPPESDPRRLFDRIFGGGFRAPGAGGSVDPRLRLRRSVLDFVLGDAHRLRARLGASDRARLDRHLDAVRALETRLARLEEDPPELTACSVPAAPTEGFPDVDGRPPLSPLSKALTDVLVMALACDQTRVFSNCLTYPVNNLLFPGARAGHHQLTHDEPGDQPQVNQIVKQIIAELERFITALAAVDEGGASLLDHSLVLATSDVSFGRTHSIEEYPIVLAGSAGGAIKPGLHYRSPSGESTSKVLLTILRAMGIRRGEFGAGAGRVDQGLEAIEV